MLSSLEKTVLYGTRKISIKFALDTQTLSVSIQIAVTVLSLSLLKVVSLVGCSKVSRILKRVARIMPVFSHLQHHTFSRSDH